MFSKSMSSSLDNLTVRLWSELSIRAFLTLIIDSNKHDRVATKIFKIDNIAPKLLVSRCNSSKQDYIVVRARTRHGWLQVFKLSTPWKINFDTLLSVGFTIVKVPRHSANLTFDTVFLVIIFFLLFLFFFLFVIILTAILRRLLLLLLPLLLQLSIPLIGQGSQSSLSFLFLPEALLGLLKALEVILIEAELPHGILNFIISSPLLHLVHARLLHSLQPVLKACHRLGNSGREKIHLLGRLLSTTSILRTISLVLRFNVYVSLLRHLRDSVAVLDSLFRRSACALAQIGAADDHNDE